MVRETNNVCFGQIAQETQVVVREDNKRDHLKRSTEDVSPPNFTERNSGYYERSSRLVADTDSYIRRSNSNNNTINNYQSSGNNINSSSNNSASSNPDNSRSRTRDRLYRNGPYIAASATSGSSTATTALSERTSSGGATSKHNNNSRVPPASWYEAAATYTNGPGGSGNADVSAANINNHYQTAASTDIQTAAAATTGNSTPTSTSHTAYSYASSPAHNNSITSVSSTTASSAAASTSRNNTSVYGIVSSAAGIGGYHTQRRDNDSTETPLLNKNKQKLLKSCSSSSRSGSASPTSSAATAAAGAATMTSSSTSAAASTSSSASSSASAAHNSNQTANNNSCSSISSTINSSNTNNNSLTSSTATAAGDGSNVSGILNAAALAAAASSGSTLTDGHHKSSSSSNNNHPNSSNASINTTSTSNNPSTSASHHTSRSAAVHAHFHGRSTTSSSRSHSRSPSSYSSSHSSSSSSSSTASSHSHASSPVGGRDVETSSSTAQATNRGTRSLQSAVAVPGTSSALNPSGSNVCSSSSSSSSSTSSGTPSANPVVHSEDNRPLAIRVRNLPARSSDTSLKDGLFHEYKKHGKVTWVKVVGQNAERYALVCFKKPEDVEKALEVSHDKLFFGCKIEVEPYQGYDVEDNEFRPYEAELDEYHPKSTRTLFIGNLEKEITSSELRQHFECFGEIIEIDIKKQGMSAYAFCQYSDIVSVVKAMRKMDGEHLGNNRIKLGFGKSMPTNCVWIDGIGEKISESHLQSQFSRYGAVSKVVVDRQKLLALVLYEQIQYAQTAVKEMRGATLRGRKLQVDFASRECQDAFYEKLEKQTAGSRFSRYESQSRSRASSFSRHQNSNDGCSPSNTPGSSSSSSAGIPSSAPTLSSAIVAGSSINSSLNNTGVCGGTLPSVVGQTSGNTTPARSRGSRSSRHTMDYDYIDTRRFRSYDEYSQGSAASHDEDATISNHPASSSNTNSYCGIGLRSDSPLLSRLGPIVNSSGKESSSDMLEMALSRRRCDKSPAKQKGDVRLFQKERAVLLEQLEECPSSGDESIVSPRKRIKIDHHSINSSSGLSQSHSLEEQTQHKNLNCDYLLNDSMHRKGEVRRLSECSSSLNKYQQQANHHHHSHHAINPHHHQHQQQQLSRRPSIDFLTTGGTGGTAGASGSGTGNLSARHGSTSSSNSDHHPPPHQPSSLACKRRRVIGTGSTALSTSALLSSSSGGTGSNVGATFANDDFHHHASRGRGHQLHSHHSHEASGGESADGSRPGTPLCDERPEVLPSEPRRVPRERPREPMVLPLPKFGIQFFQQYRNNVGSGNTISTPYHHHHGVGGNNSSGFTSSSATVGSTNSGSSHMLSNSLMNRGGEGSINSGNHSSLSHSSATTSSATTSAMASSGGCYLPSPSTRYPPNWRPHHHHHHHHHGSGGGHHGPSGGATPSSSSSMVSPLRSRSLSSNSSDSDVTGQASGSPSLEERIRTLDEMYERWSGGSSSTAAAGANVVKRHDFNNTPPIWQHHRSTSQTELHQPTPPSEVRPTAPSTPASRHKFLDIDVKEIQPSEIVKSVLAKKSIFDDDLQRLKKNHWYEPTSDPSQVAKNIVGVCTSPGLPNLQATKTPVVGCTTTLPTASLGGSVNKPAGVLLQRLTSLSPMNSPQASMSPYNSPSMSPSVNSVSTISTSIAKTTTSSCGTTMISPSTVCSTAGTSPGASGGSKCLQYPFPTHPPLPNTAAPLPNNQPIPPPPAENLKPSVTQPPLPPMELHQPPQPPPVVTVATTPVCVISKPKTSTLSKSLSVPTSITTSATETRVLTKSVSVPGSTNVGTVKAATNSVSTDQKQTQQIQTGNSSSSDSTNNPSSTAPTSEPTSKRSEKSHKHNHRSSEDKKSSKSDKRKNSNSSLSQMSQASAAESSDADERDFENRKDREAARSEKQQKDRQDKREKELRKQHEREERERERDDRDRLEKERIEKERLQMERLEKERLEQEERDRVQKEEKAREERERKDREDKDRKIKEERERMEREENERRDHEEREDQLRKERKERDESEQREKERIERQRSREEKERERKVQDESSDQKRDIHLLKEHQRRKENAAGTQHQAKSVSNDTSVSTNQAAQEFFRQGETERHNNKENSTEESSTLESACAGSGKHKNRKTSRNTSPVRHPKRRLSSQDSNASNSGGHSGVVYPHSEEHAKRMRIDSQSAPNPPQTHVNNHNAVNNLVNERRDTKEHHGKDKSNKHNRMPSTSSSHKSNMSNSNEKEHSTKHHRNKHHHKQQQHANTTSGELVEVNVSKSETEVVMTNCVNKSEDDHNTDDHDMEAKPKSTPLISSEDEEVSEIQLPTHNPNKTPSGSHKHKEHGSGSGGHHSRHKSSKRERDHHREKKRHSTTSSIPPPAPNTTSESVPCTPPASGGIIATDEEMMSSSGQPVIQRRISGHNSMHIDAQTKPKREHSTERKLSRCSEELNINQQPQTPSSRQNSFNKSTPQSGSRRMLLSSAEETDGGGGAMGCEDDDDDSDAANRKHSIFDIPDEGPYVSMYDKVKARSCKNMQKQEEEKKIKAKFSQLKQSRAKREEKKRSTSYDGDSDSDFEGAGVTPQQRHQNRSGGSYKMLCGGLTSTDEEHDREMGKSPTDDRRRNSQASSSAASTHPHRLCSDSDDNSENQRRLKLQDNIRRLCDVDDSSDDDLIRRNNSSIVNKRLLHHTSRIASDSESQSTPDIKLKLESIETSNDDGKSTPILKHLKHKIKKEVDAMEAGPAESSDFDEIKLKHLNSLQSSADEQAITGAIKMEPEILLASEIKKEFKDFYDEYYRESEQKFGKSPVASASQHCSPEQAKIKKHKKSKKRQKTPTQDSSTKEQPVDDIMVKHSPTTNIIENTVSSTQEASLKNAKHLSSSPSYDAFDELKRGEPEVANVTADTTASAVGEKKRHKDRKEKKREKLRHMSADVGQGLETDKVYEKEKHHRLKKSKKSKSLDLMRQNSSQSTTSMLNLMASGTSLTGSFTPQHKQRSGGEKMEDIFGPISDEEDEDMTDSDIAGRDLNCLPNRNASSSNVTGPIVSAALNPYKQEPLTPKSHTVEENEENKQKCASLIGTPAHLDRAVERQQRKEKREKKRKDREKSRTGSEHNQAAVQFASTPAVSSSKPLEDENSVDLDAAGRALEAQLMEDSDNKVTEEATPSTATTYRSDMTDVFHFSDGDENSLDMGTTSKIDKKDNEKEPTSSTTKSKEKKKKKKRSKEEKQLHHQRRESSSSNASQQAACAVAPCCGNNIASKLTVDIQAATKHALKSNSEDQQLSSTALPLCKPSPSLPCLIGEDDEEMTSTTPTLQGTKSTPNTSLTTSTTACVTPHRSSKDLLTLSPHMRDKQMISPIPKTPTISNTSGLNSMENLHKLTPTTPTSSIMDSALNITPITTTPTSSTGNVATAVDSNLNKSNDSTTSSTTSNAMASPTSMPTTQKKKPDIFIPGFDGEIDERISESAVQSISAEFNPPLDPSADEPKIPVESPPDASKLDKLEESKSRVTISQEETESAVSALLGESFGNSSADYSFNDDDDVALEDLNNVISEPEPAMTSAEPDEEAALAAKAIECEVASAAITDVVEEDSEEVCKAIQSLRQEELEIKADTPQSVRDLQIDTDTEENPDEADSSGSHSLKIDETAQSNTSSSTSDKINTTNPLADDQLETAATAPAAVAKSTQQQSSVITKVESPPAMSNTEPKIEPPTITKQDQPAIQPVQSVIPTSASVDISLPTTVTSVAMNTTSTIVSSMTPSSAVISMSYTSTPIKTPLTFSPSTTASSTPKQAPTTQSTAVKPSLLPQGTPPSYAMHPPTITIPEPTAHFVVPQLVLSPRGIVTTLNDTSSSTSSSIHSPQPSGHHYMPPQSPIGAAYMIGMRAQSPHSPRHSSRGNTPTPRQQSPHTPTAPPAVVVTPQQQQQQQNILIQRTVHQQQQQMLMSPTTHVQAQQSNSPLASPNTQQRPQQLVPMTAGGAMQKVPQQHSPGTPEQHMIKINNYSTPPSQTGNVVNIRIPPQAQQSNQQPQSPQQSHAATKTFIDQHSVSMGQHILPISVQKMPPVPTHPTIISKVVTVTPQQAQQSTIHQGPGGPQQQQQSPKSTIYSPPASRQSPQIMQQMGKTIVQQQQQQQQIQTAQQQNAQMHMMQQRQQQQHHQQQQQQQRQQIQQHIIQMQHQQQIMQQQHQKLQQTVPKQHVYASSQQQRGITSPQQQAQQHTQAPQQPSMHQQQHQLKAQYQHQQHVAQQLLSGAAQPSTTQQQNVIQTPSTPQRFLVQQHIVGIPSHIQQQQQHSSQQRSSPTMQQASPIYGKSQSQPQLPTQHSPSQQRLPVPHQESPNSAAINETSRVIVSTSQSNAVPSIESSGTIANVNLDKQASPTVANNKAEVVSVIRTPTPTTPATGTGTGTTIVTPTPIKETPATVTTNVDRSAPLTEENVIKISPPKQDEIEQDSKEDSDYWSAKELNVVESNNTTSSTNTSTVSTVIKKNETVTCTATTNKTQTIAKELESKAVTKPPIPNETKPETKSSTISLADSGESNNMPSLDTAASVVPPTTTSYNLSGNVTTDHDTEDETETQQMPAFEQVSVQGRPNTRGTGAKRGRQPRGGKKATATLTVPASTPNQQAQPEVLSTSGVQTRLRKPNTAIPATRGRKGRPPRNLLLQQQSQQQEQQVQSSTPQATVTNVSSTPAATSPMLTAAEKKARSQAAAAAATLASLSESHQQADVYEFHDDSGEESKSSNTTSATSVASSGDSRPRLILTIKSPHPTAPLVKTTDKSGSTDQQQTVPTTTETQQDSQTLSSGAQAQAGSTDPTTADPNSTANTRKSRRLLEKDRSTIDDIIEDVVRNTAVPGGVAVAQQTSSNAPAVVLTNTLPKGAQTPPRRSGRNSAQPKARGTAEVQAIPTVNPIGRPRKSKDRKSITDLDNEQTPSPQPKPTVHDVNDVEENKTIDTPTPSAPPVSAEVTHQTTSTTTPPTPASMAQQQPTSAVATTIPQHPKKKALAAAEIESYQTQTTTPNIHSALPAGMVPMLNTAAPASQKTTGGAADSVNKPLIDPVTGIVSGLQMQQAKEGNLPSATAAAQPPRVPLDPKKMMQAAVAAAASENCVVTNKTLPTPPSMPGSVGTPIAALTKPVQTEATAASTVVSSVASALVNKSVSVVVKTSTVSPTPSNTVVIQQQIQIAQANQHQGKHQQPRSEVSTPTKQPIIMQQQAPLVMHAQHSNVRPPTSLKAHVSNSQKMQQHPQQMGVTATPIGQQPHQTQQKQSHQLLQQPSTLPAGTSQTPGHVIQSNIAQRPTPQHSQLQPTKQQLLVNIPAPAQHSPHAVTNTLNSPRLQHSQLSQHQAIQHQPIIMKQGQELHPSQILHVVSSKAAPPTPNKTAAVPHSAVHHIQHTPSATHPFNPYIQQTQPTAQQHSAHQPPLAGQQKTSGSPMVLPPGLMGLPTHPSMVIQTKTSVVGQSTSGSSASVTHLHPSQHTPSPPLQAQHLGKTPSNPMLHTLQTQGAHVLSSVGSPPPSAVKTSTQTSTMTTNVVGGVSNLRTAIPTISPQSQNRMGPILLPGGIQVPPHFETNMSDGSFAGGPIRSVPTREHLMIYQQLLRQHDPLNPAAMREYDDKLLGSSPPLELRRPGSVPRTVAVPHSLQSPQDRATDSPQVAQVYVHNSRIPAHSHYDVASRAPPAGGPPSAYYDPARQLTLEPPPAHRSAAAHSVAAPPPTVVVPHPSSGSSSPYMPAAPPTVAVQAVAATGGAPGQIHHPKILEREREQREREREQLLMREKEQILVRAGDAHGMQVATPPPSSHQLPPHAQGPPPPQADSLLTLLQRYPVMWQGLLALKTDQAAVQMHFVFGNPHVARASLPCNSDGSTPPLRIAQRMRLEQTQLEGVAKKMQFENEHCMLLALPCGRDHADVLQQSRNLQSGFITYLQQKMAAGIVNIPMPGSEQAAYVVHIFPSCDFANENLEKAAPDLKNRVADIAHLLIVIATV